MSGLGFTTSSSCFVFKTASLFIRSVSATRALKAACSSFCLTIAACFLASSALISSLIALSTSIFIFSASALKFFDFSFITLASARVAAALIVAFSAAILASIANLTDASPLVVALASAIALIAFI